MTQTDMYENQSVLLNGYCQSCGMPFRFGTENQFGTRDDRSLSGEYCYLCLRDGVWVDDLTLEQMIDMWVEHTDMYNEISGTRYSPDALRAVLMKRLPTLKRWHGEVQVIRFHRQAVWNVKKYVTSHINEDLKVERLCLVANMSLSHLRRVFKLIAGESIGVYIQRVRLERIAYSLLATDLPVKDIMLSSSFQTKHSLAKAFTQYFGLPPTEYRKKHAGAIIRPDDRMPTDESAVTEPYHIKKLNACRIVCMEMDNAYRTLAEYRLLWKRFIHELTLAGVDTGRAEYVGVSLDDPQVTPRDKCCHLLGATITPGGGPMKRFTEYIRPAGLYAIFRHTGGYHTLPELYSEIYGQWLPDSAYRPANTMSMEVYVSMPLESDTEELITDIYIPIEKK